MPTENINIESQVQSDITRADLQALIAANTVKKKIYHISDAVAGAYKLAVFSLTNSTTSFNALNYTQGRFGKYYIGPDVFVPIVEGQGAVLSYNAFAVFPTTGQPNTIYIDLSDDTLYYWDGSVYVELTSANVYEPTVDDFPTIGSDDTLYIATETGTMYLWNTTTEQYKPLNNTPYIPLAGTEVGSPVTGSVEVSGDGVEFFQEVGDFRYALTFLVDSLRLSCYYDLTGDFSLLDVMEIQQVISGNVSTFRGMVYNDDYSANFTLRSLIDLETMKKRIWTKAGIWDANDDSAKGFIQGSLLWDTTNSKMYECTDNTAGAATWSEVFGGEQTMYDTIRFNAALTNGQTLYAVCGLSGSTGTNTNNLAVPKTHKNFRVAMTSSQHASGSLVIDRIFESYAGAALQTDTLTIPAGSAAGTYTFSSATYDASAGNVLMKFRIKNNATSTSGIVLGIENSYV